MINKLKLTVLCTALGVVVHINQSNAQQKNSEKPADTVKAPSKPKGNSLKKIKPYAEVINKNFKSQKGLFTVHRYKDTTHFELSNDILNRDILIVNRLASVPNASNTFPGSVLDEKMIRFELGADSSIKMKLVEVNALVNPNSNIAKAVQKTFANSTIASFPIKAYATDSASYVIDLTKYLAEPGIFHSFSNNDGLGKLVAPSPLKDVEILSVHTFAENVEFMFRKNMTRKSANTVSNQATVETYTSMLLLPEVPMRRRLIDDRVGFFERSNEYYDDSQHRSEYLRFATRWRLEPKDGDVAKWKRGELVEPKKPIIIYIDPATPKQWVPYLIQGVNDWQKAFEAAGFKNAIIGKEWPVNDPNMHLGDARHSMIQYYPSTTANASGPHVGDPRSGEIIHTRINWYHNVMDVLDRWFKVQTAAVNPSARKAKLDDKTMGELVKTVSSHEVGHTLGLKHNFGSSSFTPVEQLRDAKYLKLHGHTVSIMDYARFNYVAQPEDKVAFEDLFPKVGAYDKWAIKWGYGYVGGKDEFEDSNILKKIVGKTLANSPNLVYLDGEMKSGDPRAQTEDLGDDAVAASNYGIKNLKLILANLNKWFKEDDQPYITIARYHQEILSQHRRYVEHVTKYIGAFTRDPKVIGEAGSSFKGIPKDRQVSAMKFLDEQVFTTQKWMIIPELEDMYSEPTYVVKNNATHRHVLGQLQHMTLNTLLHDGMFHKIWGNSLRFGDTYTVEDHLKLMNGMIWRELNAPKVEIDHFRRNLQKTYIGNLADILKYKNVQTAETDVPTIVKFELVSLKKLVETAINKAEGINKMHLEDVFERISHALNPKN